MNAESFAMITFTPPSNDINIRYAYMYSFDDQLQVPHIPEQDHSMEVSGEFGCLKPRPSGRGSSLILSSVQAILSKLA